MLDYCSRFKCIWFLFFLIVLIIVPSIHTDGIKVLGASDDFISELYSKYKEAAEDDLSDSMRRLFTNNRKYRIHVKKLKEVNGLKTHNLMIKEEMDSKRNPLIYINNPVESKFPNAYLTLEEFKQVLINRVQIQRETFTKQPKLPLHKSKIVEAETSKLLTKEYSRNYNHTKTTDNEISSTKPYTTPTLKSTISSRSTSTTSKNIIDSKSISKPSTSPTTSIITLTNSKQTLNEDIINSTETLKNDIDVTTEVSTTFTENIMTSNLETLILTDDVSLVEQNTESITTEDFTEKETRQEEQQTSTMISTETMATEETQKTRRTLGRPLVFMGS